MVLKVHVCDESAIGYVILRLLFVFQRFKWEHIKAVNFFHLTFGLSHTDLVNLATERLTPRRGHLVKIAGKKDLPIVSVA